MKYDFIFVVVCYINSNDLENFLKSLNKLKNKYKVIVINNYYNEKTKTKIEDISLSYDCAFFNSRNKGYGTGNNIGIKYALKNYLFDYLIICNPDTEILFLDKKMLEGMETYIIAPEIRNLRKKRQNPHTAIYLNFIEKLEYFGFTINIKFLYLGIILNKIVKFLYVSLNFYKMFYPIFAPHGSFIIFSKKSLEILKDVFDEKMFLYCEESEIGRRAKKNKIPIIYNKKIKIFHKEDGSVSLIEKKTIDKYIKESYIYYYLKWNTKG